MDKYIIGQKVKIIGVSFAAHQHFIGTVCVILEARKVRRPGERPTYLIDVEHPYGGYGWIVEEHLRPIDEGQDFKRFMENVLKPVDLGQPVSA